MFWLRTFETFRCLLSVIELNNCLVSYSLVIDVVESDCSRSPNH